MINREYLINSEEIQTAIQAIEEFQQKADAISEESTKRELMDAWHYHGMAQEGINQLRTFELLQGSDYTRFFNNQLRTADKIHALQKGRKL